MRKVSVKIIVGDNISYDRYKNFLSFCFIQGYGWPHEYHIYSQEKHKFIFLDKKGKVGNRLICSNSRAEYDNKKLRQMSVEKFMEHYKPGFLSKKKRDEFIKIINGVTEARGNA